MLFGLALVRIHYSHDDTHGCPKQLSDKVPTRLALEKGLANDYRASARI